MMKVPKINGTSIIKQGSLYILSWLAFILEDVLRFIYMLLPMGLFVLMMSLRKKCNAVSALNIYDMEKAEFQFIYPDVMLILMNPRGLQVNTKKILFNINGFLGEYRYVLACLLMIGIIIAICCCA